MESLPADWLRYWDADEQRHYYFHGVSQETAWELPPGASWEDGDEESAAMAAVAAGGDGRACAPGCEQPAHAPCRARASAALPP